MDSSPQITIQSDDDLFVRVLPPGIQEELARRTDLGSLLEVVLDLGRAPEARFARGAVLLGEVPVLDDDIRSVTDQVSMFGGDNRAGIERTLHRISAIRNRSGRIIGLTCRVGRAMFGTIDIIQDIVETGKSILLLGRPGIGKTTKLREIARVLSDKSGRRVVVVDTSNEIGGDGDVPHPAIGRARRMQVATPREQHAVMIEAVENHMPEVVVIDEISAEAEAMAARTIAERGVQLVATAHGNTLENVLMNPTLSDLVGGVQAVTLGDEEARRRGTQKTVLERRSPPTFDMVIEMIEMDELAVHHDVAQAVDLLLRGQHPPHEVRRRTDEGSVERRQVSGMAPDPWAGLATSGALMGGAPIDDDGDEVVTPLSGRGLPKVFIYGVSRDRVEQALRELRTSARITKDYREADIIITLRVHEKRFRSKVRAVGPDVPVYFLRGKSLGHIVGCLKGALAIDEVSTEETALEEARAGIERVAQGEPFVELKPQNSYVRKRQHELANAFQVGTRSVGRDPFRRVVLTRGSQA